MNALLWGGSSFRAEGHACIKDSYSSKRWCTSLQKHCMHRQKVLAFVSQKESQNSTILRITW